MSEVIKKRLSPSVFKGLLLDLEDRSRAGALKAHEMVRDHAGLDTKRGRRVEGQARFPIMEQGFQEVCELHGGKLLTGGIIPNTNLKIFQPFMRFELDGQGFILGLAAIPEPKILPTKNRSRIAGVALNYYLSPRLDLDGSGPKHGDIFILFLVSRNRERAGLLEEIAIGAIDSGYEQYLFYESLDKYLEGHADKPSKPDSSPPEGPAPSVRLKPIVRPYIPPETPDEANTKNNKKK